MLFLFHYYFYGNQQEVSTMAEMQDLQELKSIGLNIKTMRTRANISQYMLARNINISQTHLSNIENGKTGVSLGIAIRISKCLNCSLDSLIYGPKATLQQTKAKMLTDCTVTDLNTLIRGIILEIFVQSLGQMGTMSSKHIPQFKEA